MKPQQQKSIATRFLSKGALLFLIKLLPALAVVAVMWLYARRLDLSVFGHYQNFWIRYSLLSTLTSLGLPTYLLLLPREEALALPVRARYVITFVLWCLLAGALFAWWEATVLPFWVPMGFLLLGTSGLVLEAALIALRAHRLALLINIGYAALFLGVHFLALQGGEPLLRVFVLLLALGGIKVLAYGFFFFRSARRQRDYNPVVARPDTTTWLHIGVNDIIQQSSKVVDKFLVSFLSTPALSAIYFMGAQELPFLSLLLGAVSAAFMQQVSEKPGRSREKTAYWIGYTSEILAAVVFPLFCFLTLCRYEIIYWLFTAKFEASVAILTIANYCILFRIYPFTAVLLHLRGGKWVSIGSAGHLFLSAALAFPLYRFLGLRGIILSVLISDIALGIFYVVKMRRLSGLRLGQLLPLRAWLRQAVFSLLLLYGLYRLLLLLPVSMGQRVLAHGTGSVLVAIALLGIALQRARRTASPDS